MKILRTILSVIFFIFLCNTSFCQGTNIIISNTSCTNAPDPSSQSVLPQVTNFPYLSNYGIPNPRNFVRSYIPQQPTNNSSNITCDPTPAIISITKTNYLDGLGRPLQEVFRQGTYDNGYYDIINTHTYDEEGRESYKYSPYSVLTYGSYNPGKLDPDSYTNLYNAYSSLYPGDQPYSQTIFDNSPLNLVLQVNPPGNSWVGNGRGVQYNYHSNGSNDAPIANWAVGYNNTDPPTLNGYYSNEELYAVQTTDEDNKINLEYKDKSGRPILKRAFLNATSFAETYYVYDDIGNLRWVISPEAVNESGGASYPANWSISAPILNGLCYRYYYDQRNRIIERQLPGKNVEYFIYDNSDRVVLSQDGNERLNSQWKFNLYDDQNRITTAGLVTDNSSISFLTSIAMKTVSNQSYYYNPADFYYYLLFDQQYISYPLNIISGTPSILVQNYYNDYSNVPTSPSYYFYSPNGFPNLFTGSTQYGASFPYYRSSMTRGMLTYSNVSATVNSSNLQLNTVYYYDEKERMIQKQSDNHVGGIEILSNEYDFAGNIVSSVYNHNNPHAISPDPSHPTSTQSLLMIKDYGFDYHSGRPTALSQKINNSVSNINNTSFSPIFNNLYDPLGRLRFKSQCVINNYYDYNIRGWLTGINKSYMDVAASTSSMYFCEQLSYDNGFTSNLYNGNISGIVWRDYMATDKRSYGYTYDNLDRLTCANFNDYDFTNPSPTWNQITVDYTMSNVTYDNNGNIQSMNQKVPSSGTIVDMDLLTYTSFPNSNQLQGVVDNGAITPNPDFKDDPNNSNQDYLYDPNGNLAKDDNKAISSISYTDYNKPQHIVFTGLGTIDYVYDGEGNKLQKIVTDNVANITTTTDYIGPFVYQNNSLQFATHEEGRCRPVIGVQQNITAPFVYDYFAKDHLGNVRDVVNAQAGYYPPIAYNAGLEISQAAIEGMVWSNLDSVRGTNPFITDTNDVKAAILIGTDSVRRIGTSIMLRVMPGDQFTVSSDTYYDSTSTDRELSNANVVGSLIAALSGGTAEGLAVSELPGNQQIINSSLGSPGFLTMYDSLISDNSDPAMPAAFLNYMVFDDEFKLVPQNSGVLQVSGQPSQWNTVSTNSTITIDRPGYVTLFSSSLSFNPVAFNNVMITYYQGSLLENNHYYPFGLTLSTQAANPLQNNNYKYNTKELQHNEFASPTAQPNGLELYDYGARMQDMQLGKWVQMDPSSDKKYKSSPYAYGANNPVLFVDPDGKDNIIYLINLPTSGISSDQINAMVGTANAALGDFGINAQVKVFNGEAADFSMRYIDKTDHVAVIGQGSDVSNYMKNLGFPDDYTNKISDGLGHGNAPEESQQGGIGVAISTKNLKDNTFNSDLQTAGAAVLLHGLGHNADDEAVHRNTENGDALRWDGSHVASRITGGLFLNSDNNSISSYSKSSDFKNMGDFLNNKPFDGTPRNNEYIREMKNAFPANIKIKDNYEANKSLQYLLFPSIQY